MARHEPEQRGQPDKQLAVLDWPTVNRLVEQLCRRRRGGQTEVAAQLGLSQGSVSKLCTKSAGTISASTLAAIARSLSDDAARERLSRAVVSGERAEALGLYSTWLSAELGATGGGRVAVAPLVYDVAEASAGQPYQPLDAPVDAVIQQLRLGGYGRQLDGLDAFVRGRWGDSSESAARLTLAYYRIARPLFRACPDGGVERTIEELHQAGDLKRYLVAAIKAERILLAREPAIDRVRSLPAKDRRGGSERRRELKDHPEKLYMIRPCEMPKITQKAHHGPQSRRAAR